MTSRGAVMSEDRTILRAVFGAVAAEVDEAGPESLLEGIRVALRLRPERLEGLLAQIGVLLRQALVRQPPFGR